MKLYHVSVWGPNWDPGGYTEKFYLWAKSADRANSAGRLKLLRLHPEATCAQTSCLPVPHDIQPRTALGYRMVKLRAIYAASGGRFLSREELDRYLEEIK